MKNLGSVVAGVWFLGTALISLLGLRFNGMHLLMGILALIAGVLLIARR